MEQKIQQAAKHRPRYFHGMDALRTLAIAGVTFFHLNPHTFKGGYLGVLLFFVITGFLLAYTTASQKEEGRFSAGRFYIKRVKRLYPELVLVLFFSVGIIRLLLPWAAKGSGPEIASILLGYNNWWQIVQNADYFTRIANASPFTHLWFLSIEIQYILVWPLLLTWIFSVRKGHNFRKGRRGLLWGAAASAVLMAVLYGTGHSITRIYYGTDTRVFALLFGAALGLYEKDQKRRPARTLNFGKIGFWAAVALALVGYLTLSGDRPFVYVGGMAIFTLLFGALLMWTVDDRLPFGRTLDRVRPLKWIGAHSYGLFLWQYPVIFVFQNKGWFDHFAGKAAALGLILMLSAWSGFLTDRILNFKKRRPHQKTRSRRGLQIAAGVTCAVMAFGIFTAASDGTSRSAKQGQLKSRLQKNQSGLQHQHAQKTGFQRLDPPPARWHYAKSGNAAKVSVKGVTIIGDSVTLDASPELKKKFPDAVINAKESRHIGDELEWVKAQRKKHRLGQTVVVSLGTNGELYSEKVEALLKVLGKNRSVFWVNVYGPSLDWTEANNQYLLQLAKKHRNVTVIDWNSELSAHPEWLWEDGIHPNPDGSKAYAGLIYKRVKTVQQKQEKIEKNTQR
ncbi:MAG: acyltransferase family protein [Pseudoramibacter sp.]